MSAQDRVRWDTIYRDQQHLPYPSPDPLLLESVPPVVGEQRALDVACGLGQNGLWLAGQGYTVDLMDVSRVALARARAEMAIRNLRSVNLLQTDLDDLELDDEIYDLICVFRYLKRDFFGQIRGAMRPGGRVIYETFNLRYLEVVPGFNAAFLLEPGELATVFSHWQIIRSSDEGHISQLVAIKPD
jgi:SAM-dependent methyltransferase